MALSKIHVYLMPGMAAHSSIFERIQLPETDFKIHYLDWQIPIKNETFTAYAKRMCQLVTHENIVLLGVSFGGILVQEMSKFIKVRTLIVVSSVKSHHEFPKHFKILKATGAYKILPTQCINYLDVIEKFAWSNAVSKRLKLYQKYLSVTNAFYLDWSIAQMLHWQQEKPNSKTIFIHGDEDAVFPHSCNGNCIVVKGGTHIMILTKYKWFNENLPKLIGNSF